MVVMVLWYIHTILQSSTFSMFRQWVWLLALIYKLLTWLVDVVAWESEVLLLQPQWYSYYMCLWESFHILGCITLGQMSRYIQYFATSSHVAKCLFGSTSRPPTFDVCMVMHAMNKYSMLSEEIPLRERTHAIYVLWRIVYTKCPHFIRHFMMSDYQKPWPVAFIHCIHASISYWHKWLPP